MIISLGLIAIGVAYQIESESGLLLIIIGSIFGIPGLYYTLKLI